MVPGGNPTFSVECSACRTASEMRPSAGRLTLYPTGEMRLEFFCSRCHADNLYVVLDVELAEGLTAIGVTTVVASEPPRDIQRPVTPLSLNEIDSFESLPLDFFNKILAHEFSDHA